jgi:hypothetical protein
MTETAGKWMEGATEIEQAPLLGNTRKVYPIGLLASAVMGAPLGRTRQYTPEFQRALTCPKTLNVNLVLLRCGIAACVYERIADKMPYKTRLNRC